MPGFLAICNNDSIGVKHSLHVRKGQKVIYFSGETQDIKIVSFDRHLH